ncbi:MAG: hypothetical protein R3F49_19785 [Planctomycetota bacterium]
MLRSSLLTAGAIALAVSAGAQTSSPTLKVNRDIQKVQGQVKHAGVYHVATGTWTRVRGNQANVGPDVVYNNSLGSGYYFGGMTNGGLAGLDWFGTGNIPTAASNGSFATQPDRTSYTINCFEFGYCDTNTAPADWEFTFYDNGSPCVQPSAASVAAFTMQSLPANGCWTVSFDLTGTEFCLEGDGGTTAPGWDLDDPLLDSFGFNISYLGAGANAAGPLLSGDPDNDDNGYDAINPNNPVSCNPALCPAAPVPNTGNGTYFNPVGLCAIAAPANSIATFRGTGRLSSDRWLATDNDPNTSGAPEGCYYFGGYFNTTGCNTASNSPYASAYMIIAAGTSECNPTTGNPINGGTQYCTSNPNSTGSVTTLDIQGDRDPALNDCRLTANNMSINSLAFFITSRTAGFTANPAGSQGNLCLGANIGRFVGPGQILNSGPTGTVSLDTNASQWSLNSIPTATGSYAAATGLTSNFQVWHRDAVGGSATSNFSNGHSVTWL